MIRKLVLGAVAGLGGTTVMTAFMAAARRTGMMPWDMPPRDITEKMTEAAGVREEAEGPALETAWVLQHFGFGASAGAVYSLLPGRLPRGGTGASGVPFGLAVWVVSYTGWLPLLGLYPSPKEDQNRRVASMIVAHVIYGAATGLLYRRLSRPNPREEPVQVIDAFPPDAHVEVTST